MGLVTGLNSGKPPWADVCMTTSSAGRGVVGVAVGTPKVFTVGSAPITEAPSTDSITLLSTFSSPLSAMVVIALHTPIGMEVTPKPSPVNLPVTECTFHATSTGAARGPALSHPLEMTNKSEDALC